MSSDGIELGKLDWQVRARPPGSPSFERSDWIAKPWSSLVIGGVNCHKKICSTCMACMFDCWADPVVVHLLPLKSYMAKLSKQLPLHSCPGFDPQWNFEVKKDGWIKQSKRSKVWNFWKSLKSLIENLNCNCFASFRYSIYLPWQGSCEPNIRNVDVMQGLIPIFVSVVDRTTVTV